MCADIGIPLPIHTAETLSEACSILWTRHRARALDLAGSSRSIVEFAQLCGTTTSAIAQEVQANKPKKPHQKRLVEGQSFRHLKAASKMITRVIVFEPELWAYARECAAQRGHKNISKLVRDGLWKEIALDVPQAPQFQPRRVQPPNGARARRRRSG
jgi:hypothetical protein